MAGLINKILQRVWLIECFRCANSAHADEPDSDDALDVLIGRGWTVGDDGYVMCPQCSSFSG